MLISEDQIKFIVALIVSVPLSYVIPLIPSYKLRQAYSIILGTLLQFYVYGSDIWVPFLSHIAIYAIIKIRGRDCGSLITILSIVSLSAYHIYRLVTDYGNWTLDISTILMPIVCKYSLFAYAYQDGGKGKKLNENQEKYKIEQLPSFFNYLGYCLFLPTCVIGTAMEFKTYDQYMHLQGGYKNVPLDLRVKALFKDLGISLFCVVFYAAGQIFFPISTMKTDEFIQHSFLYIAFYSFMSITLIRFKYYFGWKLSLCAVHISGVSYNQKQNNFLAVQTCNPYVVETSLHLREKIANWNMSVELWLRRCVYERLPFSKSVNQMATFMISAFWHGFYGGYYFSFFFWFLQVHLAGLVFKYSQNSKNFMAKIYNKSGIVGYILLWIAVNWAFSHNGLYFHVLSSKTCLQILKRIWFGPPLLIILLSVYFTVFPGKRIKKDETEVQGVPTDKQQ